VDDVILSCGFMADAVRGILGDAHGSGIRLRYLEESEPLGTGGAVKFAQEWLGPRFFVLNGDVLTDIDLTAQLRQHERTGATATLGLVAVEDPSAYGLVRCNPDHSVSEFVEKPGAEQIGEGLINAGAYVLEREVLETMGPRGRNISIERDVFPALVDRGLFGYAASGYWLDIGTPERYLVGTYDILEGNVDTDTGARLGNARLALVEQARVDGRVVAPSFVGADSEVGAGAIVGGRTVLGHGVRVDEHAHIESSVLLDGTSVGAHSTIRSSIVGPRVAIGERCHIDERVVIGEGVRIGAGNVLTSGARIFPGVELPEGAIKF
jgi:mannose-1-phosphate guanylyltransferase